MSGILNRNLFFDDIIVECAHNDVGSSALNGLELTILEIEGRQLGLEKISETTWTHSGVVEISPLTDQLLVVAQSTEARDIGHMTFTKDDIEKIQDNRGNYFKREFEMGGIVVKLFLSVKVRRSTSDEISGGDSTVLGASDLSRKDDPLKADRLNFFGDQLLEVFKATRDDEDVSKAIEVYKEAATCLSVDDPRLGPFVVDICVAYQARYDIFGRMDDLQEAITIGQIGIARMAEGQIPALLINLGRSFIRRFERTGDLEDISNAVQNMQRAVQLTPAEHTMLPSRLNNLGNSFSCRFGYTEDMDDISNAIRNQQCAVQQTPDGHPDFPGMLSNLGISLMRRFERTGDMDDISNAIQNQRRAVQLTPEGHIGLPDQFNNLGNSLVRRFERTGDMDDISNAIQNQRRAVQLTPDGHSADLPCRLSNLGISLLNRFEHTGDMDDITNAIQNQQCAVQQTPDGHPDLPRMLSNFGISLLSRFGRTGVVDDISNAIRNQQYAVQQTPDGHADLPGRLSNLAISFSSRFDRTGDLQDICNAIRNQQCAVQQTPDGHADLPGRLSNLGISFSSRFDRTGDMQDISNAIENLQRAVQQTPDGHADLPGKLNNLGKSFSSRFERTGNMNDISNAIQNLQRAVQLTPDGHVDLPGRLTCLGISFLNRFGCTGDMDDISNAIQNQRRGVQLTPGGHADLPARLDNLGMSFTRRFRCTGDMDDIVDAIRNQHCAVQQTPDGHANLPGLLSNLGISLLTRFERTGDMDDISNAIQHQRRAAQLTPEGHNADLPSRFNNLGNSFLGRFGRTGDMDDISNAILNQRRAVQLTPDGHADLPRMLTSLGNSLVRRFERTGDLDDISDAIQNQQRAVQLTNDGYRADLPDILNNLGNSFATRFQRTGDMDDISNAIQNQQCAVQQTPGGHAGLPGKLNSLGALFSSRFERTGDHESLSNAISNFRLAATSPTGPPSVRLTAATRWASSLRKTAFFSSERLDAHASIIQLLSLVLGLDNTILRRHEILACFSQLSTAACATALSLGRPDKALEWLVQGRCIVWNQINQLRTPVDEIRAHSPVIAERLSLLSRELEGAGSRITRTSLSMDDELSLEEQAGRHIKLAKEWDQLLATIRNIPGFEDFLQPRKCADIMRRLPDEGTVVIINVHEDRCDALALMAGAEEPMQIPLPNFSSQEAEHLAKRFRRYLSCCGARLGVPLDDSPLPRVDLPEVLQLLWSNVVWPILDALAFAVPESPEKLPRIWWCPTGPLSFLPIHAAGIYTEGGMPQQCLSDFAVSSYIPTVNVLQTSKSVEEYGDSSTGLLIVSQPNTPKRNPIPFAAQEAKKIKQQLERRGISSITLEDEQGTVDGLLKAMELSPSIHLACHASQNMMSPLKSSIYLHDGDLELAEVMKKKLPHSDFAFLSACQTSTGDENLSEEVVHLAAGMLAAGYRSVVGTMWSIMDEHGPDLAEFFYESLLAAGTNEGSKIDGSGAARALHHATQRLREKISDSPNPLLVWVPYIHIGI